MVKLKRSRMPIVSEEIDSHTPSAEVSIASTLANKTKHPFIP